MKAKQLVEKAEAIRVRELRLKPSLRLRTPEEVYAFIHDRGLVSFLGGNELPSLISSVLGRPWKPSAKGFSGWMDWWSVKISGTPIAHVSREITGRDDILATRLFRRTKTFVSNKIWPTLDPIVRHHRRRLVEDREILSDLERLLLKTIEQEDSIRTDHLRKMLNLQIKENNSRFHRALANLENHALIVGLEDPHPEKHLHANIWQTWETKTRKIGRAELTYQDALAQLLESTIRACVLAPENQVTKWFPWGKEMNAAKEALLDQHRLLKEGSFLVSPLVIQQ